MVGIANSREKRNIIKKYPHTKQYLKQNGTLYTYIENDIILGFAFAQKRQIINEIDRFENLILVIEVFQEENRKKGIATELIKEIKKDSINDNIYQLIAYYQKENISSHKLWIKNDFCISHIITPDKKDLGCIATYKI